jgi:hypothetical protein
MQSPPSSFITSDVATLRTNGGGRGFLAIDDFYEHPDAVREIALGEEYMEDPGAYTGWRSAGRLLSAQVLARLATLVGGRITFADNPHNGAFQYAVETNHVCVHADPCSYAGLVFLTPNAPSACGTSFFRHRQLGATHGPTDADAVARGVPVERLQGELFRSNIYANGDPRLGEVWDRVDSVGNVYNRLILWDGMRLHAASGYFGHSLSTGRLVQVFFFVTG